MKKLMFTAAFAALIFAGCGNRQSGDSAEGMGDSLDQEMTPTDTSGMSAPVDTAIDTAMMDTTAMP